MEGNILCPMLPTPPSTRLPYTHGVIENLNDHYKCRALAFYKYGFSQCTLIYVDFMGIQGYYEQTGLLWICGVTMDLQLLKIHWVWIELPQIYKYPIASEDINSAYWMIRLFSNMWVVILHWNPLCLLISIYLTITST